MNNVTKSLLTSFALFFVITPIALANPAAHNVTRNTQTAPSVEGHAWKKNDQAVKLFDIFLRSNPITLYRVQKSSQIIKKTHETLKTSIKATPAQEAAFVREQLNKSLELVRPFIDDIRGFKDIIAPLLNESQTTHTTKQNYLTKFLNGADKLEVFTDREIKTVEQLENLLHEIQGFFADLFASLSKETKDAYKAFLAKNSNK